MSKSVQELSNEIITKNAEFACNSYWAGIAYSGLSFLHPG